MNCKGIYHFFHKIPIDKIKHFEAPVLFHFSAQIVIGRPFQILRDASNECTHKNPIDL